MLIIGRDINENPLRLKMIASKDITSAMPVRTVSSAFDAIQKALNGLKSPSPGLLKQIIPKELAGPEGRGTGIPNHMYKTNRRNTLPPAVIMRQMEERSYFS